MKHRKQRITNEFALSLGVLLLALLLLVLNLVKFYAVRGLARVISIFGTVVIVCIIVGKLVYTTWGHISEPEDMTDRMRARTRANCLPVPGGYIDYCFKCFSAA